MLSYSSHHAPTIASLALKRKTRPGQGRVSGGDCIVLIRRDADQLLDLRCLFHQVGQRDARQQLVHPLLERDPDWPDGTGRPRVTSLGVDLVVFAVDLEGL